MRDKSIDTTVSTSAPARPGPSRTQRLGLPGAVPSLFTFSAVQAYPALDPRRLAGHTQIPGAFGHGRPQKAEEEHKGKDRIRICAR